MIKAPIVGPLGLIVWGLWADRGLEAKTVAAQPNVGCPAVRV